MTFYVTQNIAELIEYKENSLNKTVLAENRDSLAMLVALEKDRVMPEHTSPVNAFVYVLEGELIFSVYDENCSINEYKIKKEEILFFKKNDKHFLRALKDTKFLVVRI